MKDFPASSEHRITGEISNGLFVVVNWQKISGLVPFAPVPMTSSHFWGPVPGLPTACESVILSKSKLSYKLSDSKPSDNVALIRAL